MATFRRKILAYYKSDLFRAPWVLEANDSRIFRFPRTNRELGPSSNATEQKEIWEGFALPVSDKKPITIF